MQTPNSIQQGANNAQSLASPNRSVAAAALGAGISAVTSWALNKHNEKAQKRENEIARSREDNAYQRAVSDARRAGLSPLVVSQNGGADAQSMTAPQYSENPVQSGINAGSSLLQSMANNRLVNAQASKMVEETRGLSINNAFARADWLARLQKLFADTQNVRVNTQKERIYKDNLLRLMNAEIQHYDTSSDLNRSNVSLNDKRKEQIGADISFTNAKTAEQIRDTATRRMDAAWNFNHLLPFGTSHSLSHSGVSGTGINIDRLQQMFRQFVDQYGVEDMRNALGSHFASVSQYDGKTESYNKAIETWKRNYEQSYKANLEQFKKVGAKNPEVLADKMAREYAGPEPSREEFGL